MPENIRDKFESQSIAAASKALHERISAQASVPVAKVPTEALTTTHPTAP